MPWKASGDGLPAMTGEIPQEAIEAGSRDILIGNGWALDLTAYPSGPVREGAAEEVVRAVLTAVLPLIEQRVREESGEPWTSLRRGEEAANLARYYAGLAGFTLAEYGDEKEVLRVFRTTGDARASENPYPVDPFESGHSIRRGAWDVGYAAGRSAERARWVKLLREEAAVEARAPGHEAAWEALNRCANALGADEEVRDV